MTKNSRALIYLSGADRSRWFALFSAFVTLVLAANVLAQAPAAPLEYSPEELEPLVAPIALYPDDLVAIILPAATNPLQLVQAERFLDKRKSDPKFPLDERWDDAVKSLVNYPEIVRKMSNDLDWTTALGEAVVTDQGDVLDAVQAFRRKTYAAGNLKNDDKQVIVVEKEIIQIQPADPQVIYVPQYNPATVVVAGTYPSYYPSPYPVYYYPYPPGAALATGIIWGAALGAAWNGGHYVSHYGAGGNNNINIDRSRNTTINRGDVSINRGTAGRPSQQPAGGTSQWKPSKKPGQVGGSIGRPTSRVGDARPGGSVARPSAGARPSTLPSGGSIGGSAGASRDRAGASPSRGDSFFGGGADRGGSAFGDSSSRRQTQLDSSRGATSRSSMARPSPSAPARSSGATAGARSGGASAGARSSGGRSGGGRR